MKKGSSLWENGSIIDGPQISLSFSLSWEFRLEIVNTNLNNSCVFFLDKFGHILHHKTSLSTNSTTEFSALDINVKSV